MTRPGMSDDDTKAQRISAWVGVAGEIGLPFWFLYLWIWRPPLSSDSGLSIAVFFPTELFMLGLIAFGGMERRDLDFRARSMVFVLLLLLAAIAAFFAGAPQTAVTLIWQAARFVGLLRTSDDARKVHEASVSFALLMLALFIVGQLDKHHVLSKEPLTYFVAIGAFYYGIVACIRLRKLVRAGLAA